MSLVSSKHLETNKSELEIFVDAEIFQNACKRVYLREVKKLNVPGFRKGKAPKKVIEKLYGKEVFFSSAFDLVCPKAIDDAVVESGLDVVGLEKIDDVDMSEEKGVSFKAILVLKPEAKIENYKNIEVKCDSVTVDAKMVNEQIEELRKRSGRLVSVENRAAKKNDVVLIDYEGFVDDKKFQGGSAKNFSLTLGSGQFVEGFENQVIGHNVGDEFEVSVVFPENYHAEHLKGKNVKFKCKLNEIKVLELKKVDDEFAKDVSKFDTLKELKDDIKKHLQNQVEEHKKEQIDSQILEFLAKNVDVQIPQLMVDERTDDLAKDFENRLSVQGLSLDKYLSITRTSGYDLKNNFVSQAEFKIRTDLALEQIAKLEKIELQDSDFDDERKRIAEVYRVEVDKVKDIFPNERLKNGLLIRRSMDFLRNNVKVVQVSKDADSSKSSGSSSSSETKKATNKVNKTKDVDGSSKTSSTKKAGAKRGASTKTTNVKSKATNAVKSKTGKKSVSTANSKVKKVSTNKSNTKTKKSE